MTRRSRTNRSVENRLAALETDENPDEPFKIIITDHIVATDWEGPGDYTTDEFRRTRFWRDEHGDWHSEQLSHSGDGKNS